jgi:c-di-GMP-binding flagellar brake protein YcgR
MQNLRKLEQSGGIPEAVHLPMATRGGDMTEETISEICGDRRNRRRYKIDLRVQYKVFRQYQATQTGTGKTINLSGGGIAFEIDEVLTPGASIELAIAWPVLLNKNCPLKLVVKGRVVRSDAALTAVRMERYEFRTQSIRTLHAMAAGFPG